MRRLLVFVLLALAASACQVRLGMDVRIERDGSGSVELAVGVDEQLAADLRDAGVDLLTGLDHIREREPDWDVDSESSADGGVVVRLSASFDDPDAFASLARSVHEGLDAQDMRLFEDLRLRRVGGGAVAFEGDVGLRPPAAPGVDGEGVAFDADDLQRLLDERGDELVRYDVRVTLPAPPREHDADEVDGATLTWRAPVGTMEEIRAVSEEPRSGLLVPVLVGLGAALVAAVVTVAVMRRRRVSSSAG